SCGYSAGPKRYNKSTRGETQQLDGPMSALGHVWTASLANPAILRAGRKVHATSCPRTFSAFSAKHGRQWARRPLGCSVDKPDRLCPHSREPDAARAGNDCDECQNWSV